MPTNLKFLVLTLLIITSPCCVAQHSAERASFNDGAAVGGLFGAGAKGAEMGGAYLGLFGTAHSLNPKEGGGLMLELGYAHDIAVPGNDELFAVSYDQTFNFTTESSPPKKNLFHPFLDVGYTRFFLGGNALHYGGGLLWHYSSVDSKGFRLEYRGYSIAGHDPISTIRISHEWGSNEI